jgi:hypothetical protein
MKYKLVQITLFIGAGYFFLMAIAHTFELKVPGLFIYYNIPSCIYQNKLIAALLFGWAMFFFTAAKTMAPPLIKTTIYAGALTIGMLFFINLSEEIGYLATKKQIIGFHIHVGILYFYWLWLLIINRLFQQQLKR